MNIFRIFKTTFQVNSPNRKTKKKERNEVQCLKYRIFSEFDAEHVFDTNPRHLKDPPFTPTHSKKLQTKLLSEKNSEFSKFAIKVAEEKPPERKITNEIWPSETTEERQQKKPTELEPQLEEFKLGTVKKTRTEKGILKNKNLNTQVTLRDETNNENNYAETSFNEDITYEKFEPIDDQLPEEEIYYFDQQTDNAEQFVVHKSATVHFEGTDEETAEIPVYNLSTHPKLNPTVVGNRDEEHAMSIGLNTFGKINKLNYPGDYSLQAASIFFDDQDDCEC